MSSVISPDIDCRELRYRDDSGILNGCFISKMLIMNNCLEYSKDNTIKYKDCIDNLSQEYRKMMSMESNGSGSNNNKMKIGWYFILLLLIINYV